jgi:Na+/alanine symporter
MRTYFSNLPTKTWLLLVVPAMAIAYPIARVVVPAVVHAVVPEVVRNVLTVI